MLDRASSLQVTGLSASYGGVPAIGDVRLEIRHGEIVTLIGANGAGKSTIIKSICGLVRPTSGSVLLFGEEVTGTSPDELVRKGLSVVPEGRRLFVEMTLRENLELGAFARIDPIAIRRDLERVLTFFPTLRDRLSERAGTFSGGQQQMIAVARALMSNPRVMLLDEPTIGLAPVIVERICELVLEIAKDGIDILLVEQNAEVALSIADRAYVIECGRTVAEGNAKSLASSEQVQKAYLGL